MSQHPSNSCNPAIGGRPPGATGLRAEAARHARDSIRALAEVAGNPKALDADRVAAARMILSYAAARKAPGAAAEDVA